ncbi:MAG: HEAT repeat domain-containing protein [Clostridiales bacterium]|nr:HEAT repeat domain-containing protein [Clostridiales bacterium]
MNKSELLNLIARMRIYEDGYISNQTTGWKAKQEADKLSDRNLLPILYEIVDENEGKDKQKQFFRCYCYYIIGQITKKAFEYRDAVYVFKRLKDENKNHDALGSVIDIIYFWWQRDANIFVPKEIDITPLIEIATTKRGGIKYRAIEALGNCPTKESREVLRSFLTQEDEKKHKEEIRSANIALQRNGEPEDIPYLERFLKSRMPNSKITAQYAIKFIKERNNLQ